MKETLIRNYPDGTRATYRLEPGSPHAGALLTTQKPWKIKRPKDKRQYPQYAPGIDSTADYVRRYFALNADSRARGGVCAYGSHLDHLALYVPLPAAPAAVCSIFCTAASL